ncbi:MAG: hypothetical protein ACLR9W_10605 [Enterobacter hormaechei]
MVIDGGADLPLLSSHQSLGVGYAVFTLSHRSASSTQNIPVSAGIYPRPARFRYSHQQEIAYFNLQQ